MSQPPDVTPTPTAARDLQTLMRAWDTITAAARSENPEASEEEVYQLAHEAMTRVLRETRGSTAGVFRV